MNTGRAFLAGVVGALAMSVMMALARAMGMPANLEMLLGTMLGLEPGPTAWMLGLMMHLVAGGVFALFYAWGFENLQTAGAGIGSLFGLGHALVAGVFMGMMPMIHPMVPEVLPAPGPFMANLGMMGIVAEIVLHLLYGAIVGAMYVPVRTGEPMGRTVRV